MVSVSGDRSDMSGLRRLENAIADDENPESVRTHFEMLYGAHVAASQTWPSRRVTEQIGWLAREWNLAKCGAELEDLERFFRRYGRCVPGEAVDLLLAARGLSEPRQELGGASPPPVSEGSSFVRTEPNDRLAWLLRIDPAACDLLVGFSSPHGEGDRGARYRLVEAWPEAIRVEAVQERWLERSGGGRYATDYLLKRMEGAAAASLVRWWADYDPGACADWVEEVVVEGDDADLGHVVGALSAEDLVPLLSSQVQFSREVGLQALAKVEPERGRRRGGH